MDKKSKILLVLFFALLIASVFFTYKRTMLDKDFYITNSSEEGLD